MNEMDISIKYKMISKIINSDDENVLNAVKSLLKIDDDTDFWDGLSVEDQSAIDEGLYQLDNGRHVSHKLVQEEIRGCFNL